MQSSTKLEKRRFDPSTAQRRPPSLVVDGAVAPRLARNEQTPTVPAWWVRAFAVALAALTLVLGACGSTSSRSTSGTEASVALTKTEYLAMLKRANARVTKVEGAAEQGLSPGTTRGHVKALLLAWAHTETQLGRSFRSVRPPANAARANALLARGEMAFGAELADAGNHLPQKTAAIGPYLQRTLGTAKGAGMIDRALAKLKAAGYKQPG